MKYRRHHNNKGRRTKKKGNHLRSIRKLQKELRRFGKTLPR